MHLQRILNKVQRIGELLDEIPPNYAEARTQLSHLQTQLQEKLHDQEANQKTSSPRA